MMDGDLDIGGDCTNPSVESEPVRDDTSSENRLDSASVHVIGVSDSSTAVEGVGRPVSLDSVSPGDVNKSNDEASSDRSHGSVKAVKSEKKKKKVQKRKESKLKESTSPVYDSMISEFDEFAGNGSVGSEDRSPMEGSAGHGFEVGDMVWGKVKSHPWWPGHIFSEKFATPSVRRSKRDGLLLVAFFGDSSYGWFDPSELIPFDSNYAEKSRQTNSKTFVKAVEEAMDEVSRRSALGLSCMCRSKQNFRPIDVPGYFSVDVPDYEPGAVYSVDAIGKARESFQPSSALDFVRRLALEPAGSAYGSVDFIKNKAKVISYRRAVYEEFDETYAQAFGYDSVRPSSGSVQEQDTRKTPSKAPLSGRQVFADTSGKGKSSAKPNKPKDSAKKEKYLFKRRDEPKEVKPHQKKEKNKVTSSSQLAHIEDDVAVAAGDYVLQKRVSTTPHDETPHSKEGMDDKPVVVEFGDTIKSKLVDDNDDKMIVSQTEDKKTSSDSVVDSDKQNEIPNSGPHKTIASDHADNNGPKKVKKIAKRPIGEMGSSEKKKKIKKEQLISDGTGKVSLAGPRGPGDNKPITSHTSGTKDANNETELVPVLGDLLSLALDPFHAMNRGRLIKTRQVFIKFRSLVFQKSLNLSSAAEDDEGNTTHSSKSFENATRVTSVISSGRPDDPTKGGQKRGPSDRLEEMAARKKKKVGEIRNLTKEKKAIKKIDESPTPIVKQSVVKTLKKSGPEVIKKTEQRVPPDPTMLMMKFPQGGSLPSISELKARFARFGPMDHSATRIYWNTFACRVVYKHKAHAQAAYKYVDGLGSLFGNTGIKCTLKEVGGDLEQAPVKAPKDDHTEDRAPPSMVPAPSSGVQLKSILKKSTGEEAAGNGGRGRVKFMLGGEENEMKNKNGASSFSKSHSTMDVNSKNFQRAVLQSSSNPLPLLPLPTSTSLISSTTQFTRPLQPPQAPNSMHYATPLAPPPPPPPRLPPPPSLTYGGEMAAKTPPLATPKLDISHQMLSLLTKCNEVVTNVTNMFGYVPYRPL
ncbi:putative PWWP domain-containing protein [Helianthus anomalus]